MSKQMPDKFQSDEKLADWFENADLAQYQLDQALDVIVANRVTLSIEESLESGTANVGAVAESKLHLVG